MQWLHEDFFKYLQDWEDSVNAIKDLEASAKIQCYWNYWYMLYVGCLLCEFIRMHVYCVDLLGVHAN